MSFRLLSLILFLIFSCDDALEYNPLDPENNPDYVAPETTITDLEGAVLDTSTVTINFGGNDLVSEYSYSLNGSGYGDWTINTSVTYEYLDEGDYVFNVKGRYASGEEDETPATTNFSVDMVGNNGIRVYKLLTEATTNSVYQISVHGEGVEDLVFFSFQIQYDPTILDINPSNINRGSLLSGISDYAFLPKTISSGLVEISFTALGSSGVSGTGSLAQIILDPTSLGESSLQIINPQYGYIDGSIVQVTESANGTVVIE